MTPIGIGKHAFYVINTFSRSYFDVHIKEIFKLLYGAIDCYLARQLTFLLSRIVLIRAIKPYVIK